MSSGVQSRLTILIKFCAIANEIFDYLQLKDKKGLYCEVTFINSTYAVVGACILE